MGVQQLRLKRKQTQHMVDTLGHGLDAVRSPSPHRGADELHRGHARGFEGAGQGQIEVRRVNPQKKSRRMRQASPGELRADAHNAAVVAKDLHIAPHGQLFGGPPRLEPQGQHALTTDAVQAQVRPALLQLRDDQGREQVTRRLTDHHGHLQSVLAVLQSGCLWGAP